MEISIIIVNWNSIDYLRDCIASIYDHTSGLVEIIVVDNASPAGDAALLEQIYPHITLIKSKENLGFAGANNLGFRYSSGKHILFLNPDTKLTNPAINLMVRTLETLHGGGVLGCTLLNEDLSVQTSCIQTFPTILNQFLDSDWLRLRWPSSRLWGTRPLFSHGEKPVKVEAISGACMLVRRDVFEQVGFFDEDYFMYAEDLDLSYRVEQAGYSNYYLRTAKVLHYGGKSSSFESATQMKWKSIIRFLEKHRGSVYALAFRIAMAFAAVTRLVAVAGMGLFRNASGTSQPRRSAKWRLVLGVMLTPSPRSTPFRNALKTTPKCGEPQL
jgi:GT2 family glycosyltransferase